MLKIPKYRYDDLSFSDTMLKQNHTPVDVKPQVFQYHKYYQVNCSAIFAGDEAVIKSTNVMLNQSRDAGGMLPVPSTVDVSIF